MHIRVDDIVEVIAGEADEAASAARCCKVLRDEGKVVVEGVNRVYRHVRRSQKNLQGGRLSKEMPIAISNVLLVCTACGKAARTGARFRDGRQQGAVLQEVQGGDRRDRAAARPRRPSK